ncbi:ATP-binding protein [Streptomyces sp. 15-116A]|uniref:ATP-binding protein n=1 Tax=Streptomyces sp. 15-116A TaxID=2259035 RepID=UPI0021B2816E|nr:ATP-binding protein [Streptomyces sp. 15-116A]MCT7351198.1 ATP-binding protein [Streptomyces sp. 15-116A]
MPTPTALCPIAAPADAPLTDPPTPDTLSYSLTLPAAPQSPAIARAATRTILRAHGLPDMTDAAVQVVAELTACAYRLTPATDLYLSLRYRDGTLRVVLYDTHPRHTHPRLATACDTRRRAALRVLACVVKACAGDWGYGDAREPTGGTRMWAVLPRGGAHTYTRPGV